MALNVKRTVFDIGNIGKTEGFSYTLQTKKDGFSRTIKVKTEGFSHPQFSKKDGFLPLSHF